MGDVVVGILLLSGTLLVLASALGVNRFDDVFSRMHAATKAATLGVILIALAAALRVDGGAVPKLGLVIVLHGCEQSLGKIGDRFARDSGFNRWADALDLVVLYPQAQSSLMPLNPKACWDWWGYTGPDYDTRNGAQIKWIAAMSKAR